MNSVKFGAVYLFSKAKTDEYLAMQKSIHTAAHLPHDYVRVNRPAYLPVTDPTHIEYPSIKQAYLFGSTGDKSYLRIGIPDVVPETELDSFQYSYSTFDSSSSHHMFGDSSGRHRDTSMPKPVEVVLESGEMGLFTQDDVHEFEQRLMHGLAGAGATEQSVAQEMIHAAQEQGTLKKIDLVG